MDTYYEKSWSQTCFQVQEQYYIFTSLYCIIIITRSSRMLKQITWLFLFLFFLLYLTIIDIFI